MYGHVGEIQQGDALPLDCSRNDFLTELDSSFWQGWNNQARRLFGAPVGRLASPCDGPVQRRLKPQPTTGPNGLNRIEFLRRPTFKKNRDFLRPVGPLGSRASWCLVAPGTGVIFSFVPVLSPAARGECYSSWAVVDGVNLQLFGLNVDVVYLVIV